MIFKGKCVHPIQISDYNATTTIVKVELDSIISLDPDISNILVFLCRHCKAIECLTIVGCVLTVQIPVYYEFIFKNH